jgi:hypothetical protein
VQNWNKIGVGGGLAGVRFDRGEGSGGYIYY